jgi:peptide deformylase
MDIKIYGDQVLREVGTDVTEFNDELKSLLDSMYDFMIESNGIGLAAPQIGISKNILVLDTREEDGIGRLNIINPKIINHSDELVEMEEGCLSVPGITAPVNRYEWIEIEAQRVSGRPFKMKAKGLLARVIMHEMDHLKGVLFVDKVEDEEIKKQIKPLLARLENDPNVFLKELVVEK